MFCLTTWLTKKDVGMSIESYTNQSGTVSVRQPIRAPSRQPIIHNSRLNSIKKQIFQIKHTSTQTTRSNTDSLQNVLSDFRRLPQPPRSSAPPNNALPGHSNALSGGSGGDGAVQGFPKFQSKDPAGIVVTSHGKLWLLRVTSYDSGYSFA